MSLPVLPQHALTSSQDLLRYFERTERLWAGHLGEAEQLDVGVAVTNPDLPNVHDANRLLEAALPPGQSPEQAYAEVRQHFERRNLRCWYWQMNAATGGAWEPGPLASLGYRRATFDVMSLVAGASSANTSVKVGGLTDVTVLPTRAAFRQARELSEEADTPDAEPTLAEARMLHLDDPHCDSLLALHGGRAVGRVTVFAVGDVGRIEQVFVSNTARRRGIGRLLVDRALEICARSLFKHVLLSVDPANAAAIALYKGFGFRRIGEVVTYRSP